MVQNVRTYILDRQEQLQRIVSYISFQRIPGEQPGIFCAAEVCASGSLEYFLPVKLFVGIQRQNSRIYQKNMCYNKYRKIIACSFQK